MRASLLTMLAAAWLFGLARPAWARPEKNAVPAVVIGSKSFTESVILGEMVAHLARAAGAEPWHRAELGGTQMVWKGLLKGDLDVYPEYTGTLIQEIFKGEPIRDEEGLRQALVRRGVKMTARLGFNNSYALGMRKELAQKLGVKRISDLAGRPELKFGISDEFFNRADGWPGLSRTYDLRPTVLRALDHNLALRGVASGDFDVTDVYTTDAEIRYYDLTVLQDDRGYFPLYHAVLLYRADLAEKAPAVVTQLHRLEGKIDDEAMVRLNARVKLDRTRESLVAADFLREKLGLEVSAEVETAWQRWLRLAHRLGQLTAEHLFLVALSLSAAVFVGLPLGVWSYKSPTAGKVILSVVGVIQTLPSLALLVFMIPLLGLGVWPAVVALFLYSLLPIVRNTCTGLEEIPDHLKESGLILGLPAWERLRKIELPMASRSILAGIKTAAVINVGTATIGALIGAGGYGQPIITGIRLDDLGLILQGAVPAALLALAVQGLFGLSERFLVPKGLRLQVGK